MHERVVGPQLAFSDERKRIILAENEITRRLPGKYVDTFLFPDGGFEVRWKGIPIPYTVFDKDQRVTHADLMLFEQKLGQTNVTTLVERVSRFTEILKNPNKRTKPVMGKTIKAIKDLPHAARRSLTFDCGSEFVSWPDLQAQIGTQTWLCDPWSPLSGHRCAIP